MRQRNADLLEAVHGKSGAIERRRAGTSVYIALAQLILTHVDHVFQLFGVGHAGPIAAGRGCEVRRHGSRISVDATGAAAGIAAAITGACVDRLGAGGQARRVRCIHRADGSAVRRAAGGNARRGLEQLHRRGGIRAVITVHAGGLAEVAQRVQPVLDALYIIAHRTLGKGKAQQRRIGRIAAEQHALGGGIRHAVDRHAARRLQSLHGLRGLRIVGGSGHAVQIAQLQKRGFQFRNRRAGIAGFQFIVARSAQGGNQHIALVAHVAAVHPRGIIAVYVHRRTDRQIGGAGRCRSAFIEHRARGDHRGLSLGDFILGIGQLLQRADRAIAVAAVQFDVRPGIVIRLHCDAHALRERSEHGGRGIGRFINRHGIGDDLRRNGVDLRKIGFGLRVGGIRLAQRVQRAEAVISAQLDVRPRIVVRADGNALSVGKAAQQRRGRAGALIYVHAALRNVRRNGSDRNTSVRGRDDIARSGRIRIAGLIRLSGVFRLSGIERILFAGQMSRIGVAHNGVLFHHRDIALHRQHVYLRARADERAAAGCAGRFKYAGILIESGADADRGNRGQAAQIAIERIAAVADLRHRFLRRQNRNDRMIIQRADGGGHICIGIHKHPLHHNRRGIAFRQRGCKCRQHGQHQHRRDNSDQIPAFVVHRSFSSQYAIFCGASCAAERTESSLSYAYKYSLFV